MPFTFQKAVYHILMDADRTESERTLALRFSICTVCYPMSTIYCVISGISGTLVWSMPVHAHDGPDLR